MANTAVITQAEWIDNASTLTRHNLNPKEQLALCVYAMAVELATVNSSDATKDYITLGFEQLVADSDAISNYMNPDQLRAAEVEIHLTNATNAGGSPAADTDAQLLAAVKLLHYDMDTLERAKLYLTGALGYHSSF